MEILFVVVAFIFLGLLSYTVLGSDPHMYDGYYKVKDHDMF